LDPLPKLRLLLLGLLTTFLRAVHRSIQFSTRLLTLQEKDADVRAACWGTRGNALRMFSHSDTTHQYSSRLIGTTTTSQPRLTPTTSKWSIEQYVRTIRDARWEGSTDYISISIHAMTGINPQTPHSRTVTPFPSRQHVFRAHWRHKYSLLFDGRFPSHTPTTAALRRQLLHLLRRMECPRSSKTRCLCHQG
jgi:hypothetical protein